MQNQKGINKTIYYQNDKLCVTELTFPSVLEITALNEKSSAYVNNTLFLSDKTDLTNPD